MIWLGSTCLDTLCPKFGRHRYCVNGSPAGLAFQQPLEISNCPPNQLGESLTCISYIPMELAGRLKEHVANCPVPAPQEVLVKRVAWLKLNASHWQLERKMWRCPSFPKGATDRSRGQEFPISSIYIYIMCIYIYILLYVVSCLSWLSSAASQCASWIPLGPQLQQVVLGDGEAEKEDNKFRWGFASTTGGSNFQIVDWWAQWFYGWMWSQKSLIGFP